MFEMPPLSQGLPRKSLIHQKQAARYQVKPETTITEPEDARLFRVHQRFLGKLIISSHRHATVRRLLKLLSSSNKHIWRLTRDFQFSHVLTNKDQLLLAKILKGTFRGLMHFSCRDSLQSQLIAAGHKPLATAIGNLKSLTKLVMSLELLQELEQTFYYIVQGIKKPRNLTKLSMAFPHGENINARIITALANSLIWHKASLTDFSFSLHDWPPSIGEGITDLTTNLKQLGQLQKLNLSISLNQLSLHNFKEIVALLQRLNQATSLELSLRPPLTIENWQVIAQSIAQLTQLSKLKLDLERCGAMSELAINELAHFIPSLKLESLTLYLAEISKLSNQNLVLLAKAIKSLPRLNTCTIDITGCMGISEIGITALITCIGSLKSITELELWFIGCAITNKNLEQLGVVLSKLECLTKLDIRLVECEQLTDNGLAGLLSGVDKLPHLTNLVLELPSHEGITDQIKGKLQTIIKAKKIAKHAITWLSDMTQL
jgi:hypothetical protein